MWRSAVTIRAFVALAALSGFSTSGCSDCSSEQAEVREFLEASRACQVDDDCVVVHTGCHDYVGGHCSQAAIDRQAASSSKWKELSQELSDCEEGDECVHCLALLNPACNAGSCGSAM